MSRPSTILDLLERGENQATAIAAPGREPLSYAGLRRQARATAARLEELGIGRNDAVVIVLSNGPVMASSFVSIATAATTAPLNPAYREKEFEFYLEDLQAKLLLVDRCSDSPARRVAAKFSIPIVEVEEDPGSAVGRFTLRGEGAAKTPGVAGPAKESDVALLLHTSGTTSRPKIVPLTQSNVCTSA